MGKPNIVVPFVLTLFSVKFARNVLKTVCFALNMYGKIEVSVTDVNMQFFCS